MVAKCQLINKIPSADRVEQGLGGDVCQRLQHICTPLCDRNLGYLDELISAPTVPLLRDPVDPLSVFERVVAFGIVHVDRLPRGQEEDLGTVLVLREPHTQLALVQGSDAIEPAKSIEDASIKEDVAWGRGVMNKVLDVHSQRLAHELIRIRSRTQPAPTALLDDGARAIANDGVAASLQRQQECGLTCPGAACDHYSRHAEVPSPVFATPNDRVHQARAARRRLSTNRLRALRRNDL